MLPCWPINITSNMIVSHGMFRDDVASCMTSSWKCLKAIKSFILGQIVVKHLAEHMYEPFWYPASQSSISWLSLQSISVLLSFVHRGLHCSWCCCIFIEPAVLCFNFTYKARFLHTLNLTLDTCGIFPQASSIV